ncbi:pseudaminic acid synthase [Bradyrhizobium sp. CCBAU 53338]|uniref:pseudaminic acid synthase n=1 Tax=Bradyrhizobium sp. CCBAU 53338 TaxID=1325111 RepID=UPI00188B56FA|nr:pseudaminic acid synthase [Bradyrhizobium sp. CCBAU 53338]QOZ52006.1 pseudaminic acid synthase [Bradyrhizobium sp. CCBAU 53338]
MSRSPEFEIAGRKIGPDYPPYIIAELSANHGGRLAKALDLIEAAAATGADALKIQTYTPDTMTIPHDGPDFQIKGGLWDGYQLHQLYKEAYTPFEWHAQMFAKARELGITIFSTPFDETAVDLLAGLEAPAYKIASFEVIDLPLIKYVARRGKPMIISTGMANLGEIQDAVETARNNGASGIALLHCTSAYPAPIEEANVRTVTHLGAAFGVVSGLSDHAPGSAACVASTVLGGSIIEKHFTLSRADGGPDAAFSLEPDEFRTLVDDCKSAWASLGTVDYSLAPSEAANTRFRRSIYAVKPIMAGQPLTAENVRVIRPGFGLPPKHLPDIIGRTAARDIAYGEALTWSAIA